MSVRRLRILAERAKAPECLIGNFLDEDCPRCQFIAAANPQTIRALLDERDQLDRSLDDRALLEGRAEAAERRVAALTDALASAEARVSGLEEGLRELLAGGIYSDIPGKYLTVQHSHAAWEEARALLDPAALPAEATDE